MIIREYDGFVDKVNSCQASGVDCNLVEEMKTELRGLLAELGMMYEVEADPDKEVEDCVQSIMNLIFETKYEW